MCLMFLYPTDGQFDYYDVVTVRQEALVYACLKVVIEEHEEELKGVAEEKKDEDVIKEDWPSQVYRLSLQIVNVVKADRDALRGDPNKDSILAYFRKVRGQKFVEWKIFDAKAIKKAGLLFEKGCDEAAVADEDQEQYSMM